MISERMIFLHAGLPKTGTTFLQKQVFPQIRSLTCISNPKSSLFEPRWPWDAALRAIFARAPLAWKFVGTDLLSDILPSPKKDESTSAVLLSDESIFTLTSPSDAEAHVRGFCHAASDLGWEDVRIVFSIRRQDNWLASLYAQRSYRHAGASQKDFEMHIAQITDARRDYYTKGLEGNYYELYRAIERVVGADRIQVLVYEEMRDEPSQFYERLFHFLRVPAKEAQMLLESIDSEDVKRINVRSTAPNTWQLRDRRIEGARSIRLRPRRLFERLGMPARVYLEHLEFRRGREISLTSDLSSAIMDCYSNSNQQLDDLLDLGLAEKGYY